MAANRISGNINVNSFMAHGTVIIHLFLNVRAQPIIIVGAWSMAVANAMAAI